jgi:regulator of sigma E protease
MAFLQTVLTFLVPFLLVLGLVVTIHELGHFLTAKAFGVAIERFAIGFGRAIFSRVDRSGVEWRVGWIPLGGYVRFAGDENDASVPDTNDLNEMRARIVAREGPGAELKYFQFKPLWQRALVIAAGPFANFVLAILIFAFMGGAIGRQVTEPVVGRVLPGSAAEAAGFQPGDRVVRADSTDIRIYEDLQTYVMVRAGAPISFTVLREGTPIRVVATPVRRRLQNGLNVEQYGGQLGIQAAARTRYERMAPVEAVQYGVQRTWNLVSTTVFVLGRVVTGNVSPRDVLGGPLQMASVSQAVVHASAAAPTLPDRLITIAVNLLLIAGLISVSVGFVNLLPIPVLDGGHLFFYAYEAVARRPLPASLQVAGYRVGLALLLCLMLFATWNDLQRGALQSFGRLFS